MKRVEKIALLTKILREGSSQSSRQELQQCIDKNPRWLIIIVEGTETDQTLTDSSPVHFHDRGQEYQLSWGEAQQYAHRYHVQTLIILPDNRRVV